MSPAYTFTVDGSHPKVPSVKIIIDEPLTSKLLRDYEPLGFEVDKARKEGINPVFLFRLIGDHFVMYTEQKKYGAETLIFFMPFYLSKSELEKILPHHFYIPYYEQLVTIAKVDPHYPGGVVKFIDLNKAANHVLQV